jgi:hypothetical protein
MLTNLKNDAEYNEEGHAKSLLVQNNEVEILLINILKELRIMNIHLAMITDNEITKAELG